MSTILSNPLNHKHEESPFHRSLSSISTSSPSSAKTICSPNHTLLSQPNSSVATANSAHGNGYQVFGVSPPEASTASASGMNGSNGPTSTLDNGDMNLKKDDNEFTSQDHGPTPEFPITAVEQQQIPTPNSQKQMIKDPFEDDYYSNLPSITTPCSNQSLGMGGQHMMEQIQMQRQNMYPLNDKNFLQRLPYAFNRPYCPPYPIPPEFQNNPVAYLNRSNPYPPGFPFVMPMMRNPMPQGAITPGSYGGQPPSSASQPPPVKKSKTKNKQNQQQAIPPQPMQMPMIPSQMMRPSMEMIRQSHPAMMVQQMAMKARPLLMPNQKPQRSIAGKIVNEGTCASCQLSVNHENIGLRCTALNQGCLQIYHLQCARIEQHSFPYLANDKDIEWVCNQCSSEKTLQWSVI